MAERTPLIAGNWKMHKTVAEAVDLAGRIAAGSREHGVDVMVGPAYTALAAVAQALNGSHVLICAQNLYPAEEGAYTGEISPKMLTDLAIGYVILGHSERRQIFKEDDAFINRKVIAALAAGLNPILCIGETLEQRQADQTVEVIQGQLEGGLAGVTVDPDRELVIAYEPVWAIGTGLTASPEQAQEAHQAIRAWLAKRFDKGVAGKMRILYGGSVKAGNAKALMAEEDIDGALVGGASLTAEAFLGITGFKA